MHKVMCRNTNTNNIHLLLQCNVQWTLWQRLGLVKDVVSRESFGKFSVANSLLHSFLFLFSWSLKIIKLTTPNGQPTEKLSSYSQLTAKSFLSTTSQEESLIQHTHSNYGFGKWVHTTMEPKISVKITSSLNTMLGILGDTFGFTLRHQCSLLCSLDILLRNMWKSLMVEKHNQQMFLKTIKIELKIVLYRIN